MILEANKRKSDPLKHNFSLTKAISIRIQNNDIMLLFRVTVIKLTLSQCAITGLVLSQENLTLPRDRNHQFGADNLIFNCCFFNRQIYKSETIAKPLVKSS